MHCHDLRASIWPKPFLCTERAPAASLNGVSDAMAYLTPPPIPSDAPAGDWVLDGDDECPCWVWEEDVPSPREAVSYTHLTLPTNREV